MAGTVRGELLIGTLDLNSKLSALHCGVRNMDKMSTYDVVAADDKAVFVAAVNAAIGNGWQPVGAVSLTVHEQGGGGGPIISHYAQAMGKDWERVPPYPYTG